MERSHGKEREGVGLESLCGMTVAMSVGEVGRSRRWWLGEFGLGF